MWPFRKKTEDRKRPVRVEERLQAVEDEVHALRRDVREFRIDANSMYEKTLKLSERLRKRAEKAAEDEDTPKTSEVDLDAAIKAGLGVSGLRQLNGGSK